MTYYNILTEAVPVLGTVAMFRSHLYAYFLDEMERLNQSKHVPSVLLTLFRCPLCVGLHAAWIWKLCTNPGDFDDLSTAGYVLGCSLASLAGYHVLEILGRLNTVLELTEGTLLNTLPKAAIIEDSETAELEDIVKQAEAIAVVAATSAAHKVVGDFHNDKEAELLQNVKQVAHDAAIAAVHGIFKSSPATATTNGSVSTGAPVMLFTQPTSNTQPATSAQGD